MISFSKRLLRQQSFVRIAESLQSRYQIVVAPHHAPKPLLKLSLRRNLRRSKLQYLA